MNDGPMYRYMISEWPSQMPEVEEEPIAGRVNDVRGTWEPTRERLPDSQATVDPTSAWAWRNLRSDLTDTWVLKNRFGSWLAREPD